MTTDNIPKSFWHSISASVLILTVSFTWSTYIKSSNLTLNHKDSEVETTSAQKESGDAKPALEATVTVPIPSPYQQQRVQKQGGLTPDQQAWVEKNCYEGEPELIVAPQGNNRLVPKEGFVLMHSSYYRVPLWVAEGLERAQLEGEVNRTNPFHPEASLPKSERSELADYKGSGYDRGHQAPAGDFTTDKAMKDATFSLANMAPQEGKGFNQDIWGQLEDEARKLVRQAGHGYIITGPMFYDPAKEPAAMGGAGDDKADGLIDVKWIGEGRVAVPTHFYKIVVTVRGDTVKCVAFVLENRVYPHEKNYDFTPFIKSVEWIEQRTGLNFMPKLPPNLERELERQKGSLN